MTVKRDNTLLSKVWAPKWVGNPCCTPHMSMMRLPDGEIRVYGAEIHGRDDHTFIVQRSDDWGMSWRKETVKNQTPGASVCSPWSGDWLCVMGHDPQHCGSGEPQLYEDAYSPLVRSLPERGIWLFRSQQGPDGDFVAQRLPFDGIHIQRLPLPLKQRQRWILPGQQRLEDGFVHPVVLFSDDDGHQWQKRVLPYPPLHEIVWPHQGYRWRQPGVEPVIAEHADGTLQMLLRTSQDCHYQCFSSDGGETWSEPEPSPFYSVATMPNLVTLSDGRLLAVWNNTTPLPELDHELQPGLSDADRSGVWEDVFTNRDALHAAISDDHGRTWRGFREIALNGLRNDNDFRTAGGCYVMFDRSVHQNAVIELPENKVLVGYGQHSLCWGMVAFDLAWLDETSREDDFSQGLRDWSIHQYLRSHHGGYRGRGHCAWNRRPGPALVPAPDGSFRESLLIGRHPDCRLVYEKEGAVWNFPAAKRGKVTLKLTLSPGTAGLRITLCDRWFNPVDPVVGELSPFSFELDSVGRVNRTALLPVGQTVELSLEYDQLAGKAVVRCGEQQAEIAMLRAVTGAVSYLHLQSLAETADPYGVLVDAVRMEAM